MRPIRLLKKAFKGTNSRHTRKAIKVRHKPTTGKNKSFGTNFISNFTYSQNIEENPLEIAQKGKHLGFCTRFGLLWIALSSRNVTQNSQKATAKQTRTWQMKHELFVFPLCSRAAGCKLS